VIKRREFVTLLGGAIAWPLAVRAQSRLGKVPRIGYLSPGSASPGPWAYHDEKPQLHLVGARAYLAPIPREVRKN
jgi:hypothetical protein